MLLDLHFLPQKRKQNELFKNKTLLDITIVTAFVHFTCVKNYTKKKTCKYNIEINLAQMHNIHKAQTIKNIILE